MVRTGSYEHSVRTMETIVVHSRSNSFRSNSFGANWLVCMSCTHSVVIRTMETPGLKQSFGFGVKNLCCTLSMTTLTEDRIELWKLIALSAPFPDTGRAPLIGFNVIWDRASDGSVWREKGSSDPRSDAKADPN